MATVALAAVKVTQVDQQRADDAIFSQLVENVAHRGAPVSQVFANTQAAIDSGLFTKTAKEIAQSPLAPPAEAERNMLRFHEYVVLYPMALIALVLPGTVAIFVMHVASFTGLLVLAYLFLRSRATGVWGALAFCLLLSTTPGWLFSLLLGQFYPDRLFLAAGFVLLWLGSRVETRFAWIALAAFVCVIVNERAALLSSVFLIAWPILNWPKLAPRRRIEMLSLGAACGLYGIIILKLVLNNAYYSSFLPTSVEGLVSSLSFPGFVDNARFFIFMNSPLILLALAAPRAALIAFAFMLPNLLGNIGGGEKVGWATPYHSYYLPALAWAAASGFANLYAVLRRRNLQVWGTAAVAVAALLLGLVDPWSPSKLVLAPSNLQRTFLPAFVGETLDLFSPRTASVLGGADRMRAAVPRGSVVSAVQAAMPILYEGRTIRFYPVDIDRADYAVLSASRDPKGVIAYSGATNYLPAPEPERVDRVAIERMRRAGYDFAHPVLLPELGLAVVARKHG